MQQIDLLHPPKKVIIVIAKIKEDKTLGHLPLRIKIDIIIVLKDIREVEVEMRKRGTEKEWCLWKEIMKKGLLRES
jgi:hypothetical protein